MEPSTPRTAAAQARSSLNLPRSSAEAISEGVQAFLGGRFDKAAVELITSKTWDKELRTILRQSDKNLRNEAILQLLQRIATTSAVNE